MAADNAGTWAGRWSNLSADHIKRWEKRLYVPKSGGVALNKLAVRIQHLGKREEFRFNTTNSQQAARDALQVFRFLKVNGWEATLAKFKPECEAPKLGTTFGDFFTAVRNTKRLRLQTFLNYQNSLRTIVAEVFGIEPEKGTSKFDYRGGGQQKWAARIDARRLEELTPTKVTSWKRARIAAAGDAPNEIATARRTVNSYIRTARSFFSRELLRELQGIALPPVLPFAEVEMEEAGSTKYVSKINARAIIAAAEKELRGSEPEAYKAFLLGLFTGLRRGEIDLLEWRMIDFQKNVIRLEETEWLRLKTADSAGEIAVEPQCLAELDALRPPPEVVTQTWSQFVLKSNRPPKANTRRRYYRCDPIFDRLLDWLRSKGVAAQKPLHELRKEVGAIIATEHGIFAASRLLRHSDISTTARHYADQKRAITPGLGKFLDASGGTDQSSAKAA